MDDQAHHLPPSAMEHVQFTLLPPRSILQIKPWIGQGSRPPVASWPSRIGASLESGAARVLCLAPDEWLVVSTEPDAFEMVEDWNGFVIADLTQGWETLELRGSSSRELLTKGCGLDWHPRSFPPGHCARTRFARIPLLILCTDSLRFELYVARSYSRYLQDWIADAAIEFASYHAMI
jgi:sarcosine oxidase, subunit gamma